MLKAPDDRRRDFGREKDFDAVRPVQPWRWSAAMRPACSRADISRAAGANSMVLGAYWLAVGLGLTGQPVIGR